MSAWPRVSLCELPLSIVDGDRGKNYPKRDEFLKDGFCLFLSTTNVTRDGLQFGDFNQYITCEKDSKLRKGKLQRGDIILTTRGTLGNVGYYSNDVSYDNVRINSGMVILRPNDKLIDGGFIYSYLRSDDFMAQVQARHSGAAQPQLPIKDLCSLSIHLPPLPIQHRIAAILSDYDSAIANARKQIELLEEAAMRLYREWFVDNADPKWEKKRIWEVCEYFRGVSYTSKEIGDVGDVPLITLKNIERFGGFKHDRSKFYYGVCRQSSRVGANDVLMSVTDMTKERRLVGHVALVPDTYVNAPISMDLIHIKGKLVSDLFLYSMFRYSSYAEEFAARASGANVLHLKPSSLDDVEIVLPPEEARERYEELVAPMVAKKNLLYRTVVSLTEARDRLLPKLMSGEIDVMKGVAK